MKRLLLILAAVTLMIMSANAQLKRSATKFPARPQPQLYKPEAKMEVAQMRAPGEPVVKAPGKNNDANVWYRRPAGAFPASLVVEDGAYAGIKYAPYIAVTPYVDYTFNGYANGQSTDASFEWRVQYWKMNDISNDSVQVWKIVEGQDLTMRYGYETDSVPFLHVVGTGGSYGSFNLGGFEMGGNSGAPTIVSEHCSEILSVPSIMEKFGCDYLKSSKNFCYGGLYGNQRYPFTYYTGAEPYGSNENGWWFGKNGYHQVDNPRYFVDGIAQAFEKPTAPYLLNQIVLDCAVLEVAAQVDMTCRIYMLDEIPAYCDTSSVRLSEEPGELIALGHATLTPETEAATGGLVFFTLYDIDGITRVTPTIDCAILVVIDGYNEPEMANLIDFSALICSDDQTDEGFGELAYLKYADADEDGTPESYYWKGLNNFFSSGGMKTGFSIFLSTENPFLKFSNDNENGRYLFPIEGGKLIKTYDNNSFIEGIQLLSWVPSSNGKWMITCNNEGALPDWLHIELEDVENMEHGTIVNAVVTADPLPESMSGRNAVIRFGIPGNYIDYLFMQGDVDPDMPFDAMYDFVVNGIYYIVTDQNEVSVICRDKQYNTYKGDIVIPNEVTYNGISYTVTGIAANAFRNCYNLSSLTIPVSVTSIANNAFNRCSVSEVCINGNGEWQAGALPSTVRTLYIGSDVTSVTGLNVNPTTIYNYSTTPSICDELTFTGYSGTLHVPAASVVAYFIEDYWCNFADIIGDAVEPMALTMSQDSLEMILDSQKTLNATIDPGNSTPGTVSWHSSNKAIATVENGVVKAVGVGECDIMATCVGKQAFCHVTVTEIKPIVLTLSQNYARMEVDEQISLTATVLPEDATNITVRWSSTDGGIATVSEGVVTAIAPGSCDIIARCGDLSDTCHVIVVEKTVYITLDMHDVSVLPNHIVTLTPTITPEPTDLKVTTSDPTVAAVRLANNKVQVVGIKEGVAVVIVGSVDGTAVGDTCVVTVYTEMGDVNSDGYVNIGDVTALISCILSGDASAINVTNADTNNDSRVSISDVTALINYVLSGTWPWDDLLVTFVPGETVGFQETVSSSDSMEKDGITISTTYGAFKAAQYRFGTNSVTSFKSEKGNITKIEFTGASSNNPISGFGENEGLTFDGIDGVWVGNSDEVVITNKVKQARASKIVVTISGSNIASFCINPVEGAIMSCTNELEYEPIVISNNYSQNP